MLGEKLPLRPSYLELDGTAFPDDAAVIPSIAIIAGVNFTGRREQ